MKRNNESTEYQETNDENLTQDGFEEENTTDTLTDEQPDEADESAKMTDGACENCQEWKDRYIRLSAEFDNFRKRTLKEKMELAESGGANVLREVLPVVDDFERALKSMDGRDDIESEREGVRLIYQKFLDAMKTQGVTIIEALGKEMDVDYFDAVARIPVQDECQKGIVIDVVQTGYMLKDKVLRFAKVVVGE